MFGLDALATHDIVNPWAELSAKNNNTAANPAAEKSEVL